MPIKQRRYTLKAKEAKQILTEVSIKLKIDSEAIFDSEEKVEVIESDVGQIYLINGKPLFYKTDKLLPSLLFNEFTAQAPKIVVDMGAVPYVCKGADVMAPGIVRIDGKFSKGDIVLIIDEKHGKSLALGESLYDAENAKQAKKGPIVKTFHYVSDKIWDYAKTITE
jgi:PUA-domain protein